MVHSHLRVTWSGTLGSASQAAEIWQFSLHFADEIGTANSVGTANALANAWGEDLASVCSKSVRLVQVKMAKINAEGKTAEAPTLSDRDVLVGAATNLLPYQVALAVTMRSAKYGKGPLTHGRFYLPVPGMCSINELDKVQNIDAIGGKVKSFLGKVQRTMSSNVGGAKPPILVSRRSPDFEVVTRYGIGDALDTVRRRRGKIREVYFPITL